MVSSGRAGGSAGIIHRGDAEAQRRDTNKTEVGSQRSEVREKLAAKRRKKHKINRSAEAQRRDTN